MTTVADILKYIETLAPPYMKMDWDNVGLLCGSRETPVTKVLVALDPFEGVCREAAEWGAELIVTHHPIIFDPLKSVTEETTVGRSIMTLCRHGISAVNAHTNLDCAPGGVNDVLAATLGLNDVETIPPFFRDDQGRQWGLLRRGPFPISGNRQEQPERRGTALRGRRQAGSRGGGGRRALLRRADERLRGRVRHLRHRGHQVQ